MLKTEGEGTYYYPFGNTYIGEWKDNKKNGQGTYIYPFGKKYEGEWKDDKKHGKGISIDGEGNSYEGDFKNDKREGQGIYSFKSGNVYKADDISFRVARDVMPRTMYSDDYESQYINTLAVAYSGSNMTLGGEYNLRENTSNVVDNTSSAFSVYGNLDIGNDVSVL